MNCARFQKRLSEYRDGNLSSALVRAAAEHLAHCPACRAALERENAFSASLSGRLQQAAEHLVLSSERCRRIEVAVETFIRREDVHPFVSLWRRFNRPVVLTGSLLALAFLLVGIGRLHRAPQPRPQLAVSRATISVHSTYPVPIYTFRREGDLVVDVLTYRIDVADATFPEHYN